MERAMFFRQVERGWPSTSQILTAWTEVFGRDKSA